MSKVKIGVLALQGDFAKHLEMLRSIGVETVEVRRPADLDECSGIIIPGGESTAILKQLWFIEMFHALAEFASKKPLFGTCAGLILMSREVMGCDIVKPFGILDVAVERNAFGRQIESFRTPVDLALTPNRPVQYPAVFIRAPRIRSCGSDIDVLASYKGEPILVQEGFHLGATFHPELTDDPAVHKFFVSLVASNEENKSRKKLAKE